MSPGGKEVERTASSSSPFLEAAKARAELRDSVDRLYPALNQSERCLAEANLLRYFEIALVVVEQHEAASSRLTPSDPILTMRERSKGNFKI